MSFIKWIHELVKKTGKSLKEVFAVIPGSMTQYRKEVRELLKSNPPDFLGAHKYSYVEDILVDKPNQVVIEVTDTDYETHYYLAELTAGSDGALGWGPGKKIEPKLVIENKNEMAEMVRFVESGNVQREEFVESYLIETEITEDSRFAVVNIAQKAESINRNNRLYPAEVLKKAVETAKAYILENGSMPMAGMHETERNVVGTCAIIHEIEYNEQTGVVSLPKVEILRTSAGNDIMEMLKHPDIQFQVSQRAWGLSHPETTTDGKSYTHVDFIEFQGFDLTWKGEASVKDTDFTLLEGARNPGNSGNPQPNQRQPEQQQQNQQNPLTAEVMQQTIQTALAPLQEDLRRSRQALDAELQDQQRRAFVKDAEQYVSEKLAEMPGLRDEQKTRIRGRIDVSRHFERWTPDDPNSLSRILDPVFEQEIEYISEFISREILSEQGVPLHTANAHVPIINRNKGLQYDEMLNDLTVAAGSQHAGISAGLLRGEFVDAVVEEAIKIIRQGDDKTYVMERTDKEKLQPLAEIIDIFVQKNQGALFNETQQSGVGVPVSITSMYIVMTAWRMTTAFQVASMHPMVNLLENIPLEDWTGAKSDVPAIEKYAAINVGESTNIIESTLDYDNYELAAGYQPQRTRVTPYAMAVTKNTVMEPVARSVALPARELRDLTDTMLWNLMIMETLKTDRVDVTTAVNLTNVGSDRTNGSWQAPHKFIIPYEWLITKDGNQNPSKVGFQKLWPDNGDATHDKASSLDVQEIILTDDHTSQPTGGYLYNTDWTINWLTGAVTLTTAGETKRTRGGGDHTPQLQYAYNRQNLFIWDAQPASGTKFTDHLLNFQAYLADAKTRIVNQHYMPQCLCWNYELQEKMVLSARFTNDGSNEAHAVSMMNEAIRISGMDPVWSTAIMPEFAIVTEKMATLYGVHTPYTITGSQIIDETGDEHYFAKQWTGGGIPTTEKLALVGIENLDKIATPASS